MRSLDRCAVDGEPVVQTEVNSDDLWLDLLGGIEVADWARAIDRIKLEVVPGKGVTYDGCESLDVCLRRVVPALRGCSPPVFAEVKELALSRLGFS